MNIKREFLYSETSKIVPVQLLRTNYGVSVANPPTAPFNTGAVTKSLNIRFPINGSFIVFIINQSDSKISEVISCPQGKSFVTLELHDDVGHWIYVISKEYNDGFITQDIKVRFGSNESKYDFSFNSQEQELNLTTSGDDPALIMSVDEFDRSQWYNYDRSYYGPLSWESPPDPLSVNNQLRAKNYWLISRQEILTQLDNIFSQANLTSFNLNSKSDTIKMIKVMDMIAEFMRDKREFYDESLGEEVDTISDIWEFLNANLPGYQYSSLENKNLYYASFDENLGDVVDAFGVYADYIRWDGFLAAGGDASDTPTTWFNGLIQIVIPAGPLPTWASRDQQARYVAATNMGIDHNEGPPGAGELDLAGLDANERYNGTFAGGHDARNYIHGAWDSLPYTVINNPDWNRAWQTFQTSVERVPWIVAWNKKLSLDYGLPEHDTNPDVGGQSLTIQNREWWNGTKLFSKDLWDSIRPWLNDKLVETQKLMVAAGDSLWSGYTFMTPVIGGYEQLDLSTPRPGWFDVSINWKKEVWTIENPIWRPWNNGSYSPDWLWDNLISKKYLGQDRSSWNEFATVDLDGPEVPDYGGTLPVQTIRTISDFFPVMDIINKNIDKLYPPIYVTISGGSGSGGTIDIPAPVTEFTLAYEAILQNIRFLKDKLNSMDENLWTSINGTNSVVLSTLISIANDLISKPESNTIVNITNSNVPTSNIQVLWGESGEWSNDPSIITIDDYGHDVKGVNLSSITGMGKHIIILRPIKIVASIYSATNDYIIVKGDLDTYKTPNYFYGYNCQIMKEGRPTGDQKVVVQSNWTSGGFYYLKLSPLVSSLSAYSDADSIEMWSNEFIPVMIEVDIVEHNALTLSYSMYAKKELDTNTGMCTIYDYAGNPYKTLSLGKVSDPILTRGHIVEYRVPAETPWTKKY